MLALAAAIALTTAAAPAPTPAQGPAGAGPRPPAVEWRFLHDVSAPDGAVRITWPSLAYDRAHEELFVVADGFVRIFDAAGMEVHRFGDDGSLGYVTRVAPLEDGEIVVLTTLNGKRAVLRCDFRGDILAHFEITQLPQAFADFEPDQLAQHDGRLYFAERGRMRVVVTDVMGVYRQAFQLRDAVAAAVSSDGDRKPASNFDAFNVDAKGNLLFTMSTMFAGAIYSPSGDLRLFGTRGSTPGKFNIIGGIDSDEHGNVYVTDRLRSVVSVWSRDLTHLVDFGYRGGDSSNLLTPYEIVVGNGKAFVAQAGKRGVKVFQVQVREAQPAPPPPPPPDEDYAPPRRKPPPRRGEREAVG
jgi:hypothetical protein